MISRILRKQLIFLGQSFFPKKIRLPGVKQNEYSILDGRVLHIKITDFEFEVWIICQSEYWNVRINFEGETDLFIEGSLESLFIAAKKMRELNTGLVFEDIKIKGSIGVLQELQLFIASLDRTLIDLLARILGPTLASFMYVSYQNIRKNINHSKKSVIRQTTDYLEAEQQNVITSNEFKRFKSEITSITERCDRLDELLIANPKIE